MSKKKRSYTDEFKHDAVMLVIEQVNRSSYYYWRNKEKSNREQENERLIPPLDKS